MWSGRSSGVRSGENRVKENGVTVNGDYVEWCGEESDRVKCGMYVQSRHVVLNQGVIESRSQFEIKLVWAAFSFLRVFKAQCLLALKGEGW